MITSSLMRIKIRATSFFSIIFCKNRFKIAFFNEGCCFFCAILFLLVVSKASALKTLIHSESSLCLCAVFIQKLKQSSFFLIFFCLTLYLLEKCCKFASLLNLGSRHGLSHGVMVTHLFLVQTFKVRVLVGQQKSLNKFNFVGAFFVGHEINEASTNTLNLSPNTTPLRTKTHQMTLHRSID